MKKIFQLSALSLFLTSTNIYASRPTADILDEDIYAMINSMVTDAPHARLTFDEMAGGITETSVTTNSLSDLETLIVKNELLEYVESLDGMVAVDISFNDDNSVTMTVNQLR